jgi:hypothetical protein
MLIERHAKSLHLMLAGAVLALGTFGSLGSAVAAEPAPQKLRVRGTVIALAGEQLQVKAREGNTVNIALKPGWSVAAVAKASVSDIKQGDYVGIASLPKSEGGDGALEVLIFPPQMKGLGEGSFGWDLKPKSTMTNATVGDAVKSVQGSVLTVSYHGQDKKISIQQDTPVVTLAPATPADLKPGAVVFVSAEKGANGAISSGQVIVGKNGVVPPM